jgi:HK97 family phage major capsid protein
MTTIETLSEEAMKVYKKLEDDKALLEKKYDGLLVEQTKKQADFMSELLEQAEKIEMLEKSLKRSQGWEKGEENENEKKTLDHFLRKGHLDLKNQEKSNAKLELEIKDLRTDNDAAGGYLVRPQFSGFISKRIFETSPMRQLASSVSIGSNEWVALYDDDETGAVFVGERDTFSDSTTPKVGEMSIKTKKLVTKPLISHEQLEDSYFNVETWLQGKMVEKFSRTENTSFLTGDGISGPRGLLTYSDWTNGAYSRGAIERVKSGANGAPTEAGLVNLQNALFEDFQNNATWLMHRVTFAQVLLLNGTNNYRFLGFQPADRQGKIVKSLLGNEVRFAADMPKGATGSLSIAYGDFGTAYQIVDKASITILRDPYSVDGAVQYKTYKRVGGDVINFQAVKIQNFDA